MKGAVRLVVVLVLALAPAAALVWLRAGTGDTLDATATAAAPALQATTARTITDERRVTGVPTFREGLSLRAPDWQGLVTSVRVAPGQALSTGDAVATVDGVPRIAIASAVPFHRPLSQDDRGPDVAALNDVLFRLGYLRPLPARPDRYLAATTAAVEDLETALGFIEPTGEFDPAWFVWLPFEPFEVGELDLEAGAPAPSAGTDFAKEPSRIRQLVLASANPQETLSLDPAVTWVLIVGKERFAIDPVTLEVAPEGLAALQKLLKPDAERVDGAVQRAEPLNVVAVPSTAVTGGASGQLCAWLPDGAGGYRAQPVTLAGARAGVTNVRTGIVAGQEVLANPAEVLSSTVCP